MFKICTEREDSPCGENEYNGGDSADF